MRAVRALGRAIGARPAETRNATASFLLLFGLTLGYSILEAARDALFLARFPATRLPIAYLAIALAVIVVHVLFPARRSGPGSGRRLFVELVLAALALLAFAGLHAHAPRQLDVPLLYVLVGVLGTLLMVRVWVLVGGAFDIGQARRSFARIAAGGLVGSISGAGFAAYQLRHAPAESLLPIAAVVWLATALVPLGLQLPAAAARPTTTEPREASLGRIYRARYAWRLFWMITLATVVSTVGDFLFKASIAADTTPATVGAVLARFQLAVNAGAFLVQLVVAPTLLRRAGANRTILAQPALTVLATLLFVLAPGAAAAMGMKAVDGTLRGSLHRTSLEVLYVPLPPDLRARLKMLADGLGQRIAQAAASLLVLAAVSVGLGTHALGWGLFAFAAAWLGVTVGVRRSYVGVFRQQILRGKLEPYAPAPFDLQSIESLMAALNSSDDLRVVATLETLAESGKVSLIPALILFHPSQEVVLRALELFDAAGRTDHLALTERLVEHRSAAVRAAVIRTRAATVADAAELGRLTGDASAAVRATALVALARRYQEARVDSLAALERLADEGPLEAQLALAQTVARLPDRAFVPLLQTLAGAADPALRVGVARAIVALPDVQLLPAALRLLAARDARNEARKAFVAVGAPAIEFLAAALDDDRVPLAVRRHIPRTLSRFGNERAAAILLAGLARAELDGVVRFKILRGLGRMRTDAPSLRLDRGALLALACTTIARVRSLEALHHGLQTAEARLRTPAHALLVALVARKVRMAMERMFRLLDLLHPGEPFERIWSGLDGADAARRASSRELLEYVVDPSLRGEVLALVEGRADHGGLTFAASVAALGRDESAPLRALAAEYRDEAQLEEDVRATV